MRCQECHAIGKPAVHQGSIYLKMVDLYSTINYLHIYIYIDMYAHTPAQIKSWASFTNLKDITNWSLHCSARNWIASAEQVARHQKNTSKIFLRKLSSNQHCAEASKLIAKVQQRMKSFHGQTCIQRTVLVIAHSLYLPMQSAHAFQRTP